MDRYVILGFVLFTLLSFSTLKTNPSGSLVGVEATSSFIENETVVYVDPHMCHVPLGSTFRVNISVANMVGLFSYDFMLYYDTDLLDGVEVKLPKGHFLEPVVPMYLWIAKLEIEDDFNSTHGRVWVAVTLMHPESGNDGSGILATITFQVTKSGNCILDLNEYWTTFLEKYGEEIACEVRDGYFESEAVEHEIAVFLQVPSHLVPGDSANVNAVVQNGGQNDETNIILELFVEGTIVDSMKISFLSVGSNHTLSYRWTPIDEATYNVTAYAPPLVEENNILNNVYSKIVASSYIINDPVDFTTIEEAIQAASPGDTIRVTSGTYYEHLIIDRPVTLAGDNRNCTIIDGSETWIVVRITASGVRITGFTIQNGLIGIEINTSNNTIEDNAITNCEVGIFLCEAFGNVIRRNTIANNRYGVQCGLGSTDNMIYHNNFINNTDQAVDDGGKNTWNYSDQGNYWSDYNGADPDEDNIGDASYEVNATLDAWDAAPLMFACACVFGDLNDDGRVNASDLDVVAASFGSYPRHTRWNPAADVNIDGRVDVMDMVRIAKTLERRSDVNDIWSPVNQFELLAPWIGLASVISIIAVVTYVKYGKKQRN